MYQCLESLDVLSVEGLSDFINELKTAIDIEPTRKGVKAQKVSLRKSTIYSYLRKIIKY